MNIMKDFAEMQADAAKRDKEVLDMVEALCATTSSDAASSVGKFYCPSELYNEFSIDKLGLFQLPHQVSFHQVQ
jgi:predicted metalloprotease